MGFAFSDVFHSVWEMQKVLFHSSNNRIWVNTNHFSESISPRRSFLSDPIEHPNGMSNVVSALRHVPIHGDRPGNGIEHIIQSLIPKTNWPDCPSNRKFCPNRKPWIHFWSVISNCGEWEIVLSTTHFNHSSIGFYFGVSVNFLSVVAIWLTKQNNAFWESKGRGQTPLRRKNPPLRGPFSFR
jgi:hypothetical protein